MLACWTTCSEINDTRNTIQSAIHGINEDIDLLDLHTDIVDRRM
jgi:hypothetical protein